MPTSRQEGGDWQAAIQSDAGVIPAFGDGAWKAIKPQAGSTLKETPTNTEIIILTNDLSKTGSVVTKRAVAGQHKYLLEAPATAGVDPSIDVQLQGLFGKKIVTTAMTGAAIGASQAEILVDEVDTDLVAGMGMLLKITLTDTSDIDWPCIVTGITLETTPTKDKLAIYPPLPTGATLQSGFTTIQPIVSYKPKTASVTSIDLPLLSFARLYDDLDEYWTWNDCKANKLTMDMTPGQLLSLQFDIVGKQETVTDSQTGHITVPGVSNVFVPLGMYLLIDTDEPIWISKIGVNYDNALGEKLGLESASGITGHAENTRNVTIGCNFQYQSRDYLDKARNATSVKIFVWGKKNVGTEESPVYSYFSFFAGNLIPTTIDTPVVNRLMTYQITFTAYRWLVGSDEMFMTFIGGADPV